jgi:hypothetical protein
MSRGPPTVITFDGIGADLLQLGLGERQHLRSRAGDFGTRLGLTGLAAIMR